MTPEHFICAASGNNARVYGLDSGFLRAGKAADIVLIDAPDGGTQTTALAAIKHGDIAAIGARGDRGLPALRRPQPNTPATTRKARVVKSKIMQDFSRGRSLSREPLRPPPHALTIGNTSNIAARNGRSRT